MSDEPQQISNELLLSFASDSLGSNLAVADRSRRFGRRSVTWKLTAEDGAGYYLKKHEFYRHYEAELVAYSKWVPELPAAGDWHSPELVAHSKELGALILNEAPGEVLDETEVGIDDRIEMHRTAGRLAARIHDLEVDPYEAGPPRLYSSEMLNGFIRAASIHLDSGTMRWAEKIAAISGLFDGLQIVPTHADYSPRNWLIHRHDGTVSLGLIDWERARPGYWLEDTQRMALDQWWQEPELRTAFFDGYGRVPTRGEERQMNLICFANALGTISWATEHGDVAFARFGHRVLTQLKQELSALADP